MSWVTSVWTNWNTRAWLQRFGQFLTNNRHSTLPGIVELKVRKLIYAVSRVLAGEKSIREEGMSVPPKDSPIYFEYGKFLTIRLT